MSIVRGGDIRQIMIGGREFDPAPEGAVKIILSGFVNENRPTGNGRLHTKQTRKLGGFDDLAISVDPERGDIEYLQGLANGQEAFSASISLPSGVIYSGTGCQIEGELNYDSGDGQVELAIRGTVVEQI
jgi:hypothetical protein